MTDSLLHVVVELMSQSIILEFGLDAIDGRCQNITVACVHQEHGLGDLPIYA
jgi:hypothetical protein